MTTAARPAAAVGGARRAPAALEEDVERAGREFRRRRFALALRALVGLDTAQAREGLREAADRLACLRYQEKARPRRLSAPDFRRALAGPRPVVREG